MQGPAVRAISRKESTTFLFYSMKTTHIHTYIPYIYISVVGFLLPQWVCVHVCVTVCVCRIEKERVKYESSSPLSNVLCVFVLDRDRHVVEWRRDIK